MIFKLLATVGNVPVSKRFFVNNYDDGLPGISDGCIHLYELLADLLCAKGASASNSMMKSMLQLIGTPGIEFDTDSIRFQTSSSGKKTMDELLQDNQCADKLKRLGEIAVVLKKMCRTCTDSKHAEVVLTWLLNPSSSGAWGGGGKKKKHYPVGKFFEALNKIGIKASDEEQDTLRSLLVFHKTLENDHEYMRGTGQVTFSRKRDASKMFTMVTTMDGMPISTRRM